MLGRVKRGQTVRLAVLDQTYSTLDGWLEDLVREVVGNLKLTFQVDGKDLTATQLLERLGFSADHLSTRVGDLSGGQKRRLQLLLVLCEEPNVLILDEPTNDVDTDTLTALEDLLDTWPGCLIVVSHDRYFIERVTDQQYAVWGGDFRHLPGGIDDYLALSDQPTARANPKVSTPQPTANSAAGKPATSAAEDRAQRKLLAALENKLAKAAATVVELNADLAKVDPADWTELGRQAGIIEEAKARHDALEEEWLELAERLES
jgi:ABC-type multidrug transport system ATPase subunit